MGEITFADFKASVKSRAFPFGTPENLEATIDKMIVEGLIQVQRYVPCYQGRHKDVVTTDSGSYSACGITYLKNPRGKVLKVRNRLKLSTNLLEDCATTAPTTVTDEPDTDGPVAWWPFEEGSGDPVDVIGGLHMPFQFNTAAAQGDDGKIGDAITLDANSNQTVNYATASEVTLAPSGNGVELLFWLRFNEITATGGVCSFSVSYYWETDSDSGNLKLLYDAENDPGFVTLSMGTAFIHRPFDILTSDPPPTGEWLFFRIRYDAATSKLGMGFGEDGGAINGESVGDISISGVPSFGVVTIQSTAAVGNRMSVSVDELGVWLRSLSDAEGAAEYNSGSGSTRP